MQNSGQQKDTTQDSVNISSDRLLNRLQETLYLVVKRSGRNVYLYSVCTRHRSMLRFPQPTDTQTQGGLPVVVLNFKENEVHNFEVQTLETTPPL